MEWNGINDIITVFERNHENLWKLLMEWKLKIWMKSIIEEIWRRPWASAGAEKEEQSTSINSLKRRVELIGWFAELIASFSSINLLIEKRIEGVGWRLFLLVGYGRLPRQGAPPKEREQPQTTNPPNKLSLFFNCSLLFLLLFIECGRAGQHSIKGRR